MGRTKRERVKMTQGLDSFAAPTISKTCTKQTLGPTIQQSGKVITARICGKTLYSDAADRGKWIHGFAQAGLSTTEIAEALDDVQPIRPTDVPAAEYGRRFVKSLGPIAQVGSADATSDVFDTGWTKLLMDAYEATTPLQYFMYNHSGDSNSALTVDAFVEFMFEWGDE